MLISSPFLPPPVGATDSDRVDAAMPGGYPGQGAYPVSYGLGWHGGIHLHAPAAAQGAERVRAIADGTVVYARPCTKKPKTIPEDHPLNYRNAWTSDGCVVIKHETEIGASAQGQATQVSFYSIYMHLSVLHANAQTGKAIYRKDEIGQAGEIYGQANAIHFEIICDDENISRLIGRSSGKLNVNADGRVDALYGEMYFRLNAQTRIYADKPKANDTNPSATAIHTTSQTLYIGMRYAGGDGTNPGDLTVTTYREDGGLVGNPVTEHEAEYNLYTSATDISDVYRKANAAQIPAPSAVYELLRFGRVIGPDALNPAETPHWRKIAFDGGEGWVNLNAAGITKFSDADFPHWKGWTLIDDSADLDSRCDSATIKAWLDQDGDGQVDPNEAMNLLPKEDIQAKLRRTLCKIPTEWERATVDFRWGWLKEETEENPTPLSNEDFLKLREHIEALAFWEEANIGISSSHWHFHPVEFIKQFRKCGWLSLEELAQLLPRRHGTDPRRQSVISWADARSRFQDYAHEINRVSRKYLLVSSARQAHFLAQTFIETALWVTMEEFGRGHQQRRSNGTHFWPAPAMEYYTVFYGRGAMQLTWAGNYEAYGQYRQFANVLPTYVYGDARISHASTHYQIDPRDRNGRIVAQPRLWSPRYDPQQISNNAYNACDSGGFYWISKNTGANMANINRVADRGIAVEHVGRISVLVNGGGFGYAERQAYASYIDRFRSDTVASTPNTTLIFTRGTTNYNVYVDFTPQRP